MHHWYRGLTLMIAAAFALSLALGCSRTERKEVRIHEEQQEGEVQDVGPGEMIVE